MSRITLAGARYWHGNYSCHALARRKVLGILPAEKELNLWPIHSNAIFAIILRRCT